jgi:hypothetical protein
MNTMFFFDLSPGMNHAKERYTEDDLRQFRRNHLSNILRQIDLNCPAGLLFAESRSDL